MVGDAKPTTASWVMRSCGSAPTTWYMCAGYYYMNSTHIIPSGWGIATTPRNPRSSGRLCITNCNIKLVCTCRYSYMYEHALNGVLYCR